MIVESVELLEVAAGALAEGARDEEIAEYESVCGFRLPETLREFLQLAGGSSEMFDALRTNELFDGERTMPSDIAQMIEAQAWVRPNLPSLFEQPAIEVPIFFLAESFGFDVVLAGVGDDPPVLLLDSGARLGPKPERVDVFGWSFSWWLSGLVMPRPIAQLYGAPRVPAATFRWGSWDPGDGASLVALVDHLLDSLVSEPLPGSSRLTREHRTMRRLCRDHLRFEAFDLESLGAAGTCAVMVGVVRSRIEPFKQLVFNTARTCLGGGVVEDHFGLFGKGPNQTFDSDAAVSALSDLAIEGSFATWGDWYESAIGVPIAQAFLESHP